MPRIANRKPFLVTDSDSPENSPQTVPVNLGRRRYDILVGTDLLADVAVSLPAWLKRRYGISLPASRCCVVTDKNVADRHAAAVAAGLRQHGLNCDTVVLEPGESSKRLDVIAELYDRLVAMKADRQTVLIAVGGGVVGDAAGFAAATYARGIPFVQVPTTLLAQVDSSVGGKVGINHAEGKNLIGAFYQPLGVVIDTETLKTLPERDYRSGLAEVVKYGVILDEQFFAFLESHIEGIHARDPHVLDAVVARCCRLKADVVEQDEEERTGLRAVLNYGHTFAHAYEALCGYGELLHGEAVAIGMDAAARLAIRLGRVPAEFGERQTDLLQALHLPTALPESATVQADAVLQRMQLDKKTTAGQLRFVLPTRMGHVELVDGVADVPVLHVLREHLS